MHKNGYLMLWLSFFGMETCALFTGYKAGYVSFAEIMKNDNTGTTLFIIAYFLIGFCFSISNMVWLQVQASKNASALSKSADTIESEYQKRENIMYYFLGVLPILGFIGTLVGFMMIATLFEHNISGEPDFVKVAGYILQSVGGIKTAAFTSIVGLVAGWIILYPLELVFRNGYLTLIVEKINSWKDR